MNTILKAKGLCKEFDGVMILKGIDIAVEKGEFVAVMGQSGSGKSTLLYNISGMDRASSGTIWFDGEDVSNIGDQQLSDMRLHRMGFVFQQSHLLKNLSIRDNIVLPGYKAKRDAREQVQEYAEELMTRTGIEVIADHDIKKVSGGQLQRAAICRALINRPDIIFGDEPTGALNLGATKEIMDILNEINDKGTSVMLVTHDAKVAARAERVIFLSDGLVTDEIVLGKYDQKHADERERQMMQWLNEQGF